MNVEPYATLKRLLDVISASLAMIIFLPVLLVVAIGVRLFLGSPVLFTQVRPGRHGQLFRMYKFRTMRDVRDQNGELLPDTKRVTRFGNLLRKMSLDELPELWNIVKGEMSFVGPRPLLPEYLPYYSDRENLRHTVRPGLTGLAQISGRNNLEWNRRLELDAQYAETYSLKLDIWILMVTLWKVVAARDVTLTTYPNLDVYRTAQQSDAASENNQPAMNRTEASRQKPEVVDEGDVGSPNHQAGSQSSGQNVPGNPIASR